jgi:hypothetical protein
VLALFPTAICLLFFTSGCDSHLIIKRTFEIVKSKESTYAVPNLGDELITFLIGNLNFIDTYQFMKFSSDVLTRNLKSKTGDPYSKFTFSQCV